MNVSEKKMYCFCLGNFPFTSWLWHWSSGREQNGEREGYWCGYLPTAFFLACRTNATKYNRVFTPFIFKTLVSRMLWAQIPYSYYTWSIFENRASKNLIHGLTTYKISATPGFKGFPGQETSAHSIAMRPCICRGIPSLPKELLFRDGIVVRPCIVGGQFSMKCTKYSNMVALTIPILSCL